MLVVAAFSLAIYYWAMRTKLPREEMLELVNRQAGGAAELPPAMPALTSGPQQPERPRRETGPRWPCGGA